MKFKKIAAMVLTASVMAGLMAGCGASAGSVVARAGSEAVTYDLVYFMSRYEQASMDDLYRSYFGESVWDEDLYGSGSTMEEETKNDVMDYLHELYTLADEDHMAEYGVALTEEEEAAIKEAASAFISANSKEALKEMGASQELAEKMLRLFTIKSDMHAAIIAGADTEVSDEEANMRGYTYIRQGIDSYYDSSSASYVAYTEDEIAEMQAAMESFALYLATGADLEEAAEQYDYTTHYGTYDADDTSLDADVRAALETMEVGDVSSLIVTDSYLYIVRLDTECDEEATEENRADIIEERQETLYDDTLAAWQEGDGWSVSQKYLDKISFKNTFTQETEEAETESVEDTEQ